MFAVPGWSISADSLKTQINGIESVKSEESKPNGANGHRGGRKRKRDSNNKKSGQAVTSENFVELWETVIEGKEVKKIKQSRTLNGQGASAQSHTGGESKGIHDVEARKTLKQKKREKKLLASKDTDSSEIIKSDSANVTIPILPENSKDRFEARKAQKQKKQEEAARLRETGELPPSRLAAAAVKEPSQARQQHETAILEKATKALDSTKPVPTQTPSSTAALTPLQAKMRSKLTSARFRHLNQTLYTTPSISSYTLFTENPDMFEDYHAGFRQQVEVWPENPVNGFLKELRARGNVRAPKRQRYSKDGKAEDVKKEALAPLPRTDRVCVVADLGCGDAKIAQELQSQQKKLKINIKSFDLGSNSPLVTKADISALPLKDGSVDIAIFCLALMGTNWLDFIEEAYRILRWKGELWIAEIKSRFGRAEKKGRVEHSVGNRKKPGRQSKKDEDESADAQLAVLVDGVPDERGETDISAFIEVLRTRGFVLKSEESVDKSNKMFVKLSCIKALAPVKGKGVPPARQDDNKYQNSWQMKPTTKFLDERKKEEVDERTILKPCVYKLR